MSTQFIERIKKIINGVIYHCQNDDILYLSKIIIKTVRYIY